MSRKLVLVLIVSLLASLLIVPVGAQEAGGGGELIGAFDVGPGGAPMVRPYMDTAGRTWLAKIWSTLVTWNSDQSGLQENLAVDWSSNDDATLWTFKLREGVKWHDGEDMTADDVVFSLNLAMNPDAATQFSSFSQFPAANLASITAVDDYTVEIALSVPMPRLPFAMTFLWVLPEHALADLNPADYTTTDWFYTEAIGTGPFMHEEFVADQFWATVPNPNYWQGAPKLDRLINRYFADETAAVLAFESGEIHFTYVSGDVAIRLQENPAVQMFDGPSGVTNYYIFNTRNPILQDVRVRQAFLYAIDRQAIAETVLEGTAQVVPCISPFPGMWPDASELNDYAYNPDMARTLLAEAGYDSAQLWDLFTYYNNQFHLDAMAAQQAFLADAGITISPVTQDVPTYNSYFYSGEGWDISYRGVAVNVGNFPFTFYEPGGFETSDGAPLNGTQWDELQALIDAAKVETDADVYLELLKDICVFQNQNAVEGYMWTATRFGAASDKLVDFYWFPGGGGGPYEDHAELWAVSE
jgi:peptide/nickel transport system substrate-binding protein